ncbi:MAG: class I SAM-dependent methyltransferase [Betaproteobacteria bacterium]|nr:class I SAM-dependent methyltransferase [Betaproteobacteria bacterium]
MNPSAWVSRYAPLITSGGKVLDLACGSGRHARLLAGLGYSVEAVDSDAGALAGLRGQARITTRCADLEDGPWPYGGRVFAGIVVVNYLWRPLLPQILAALDQGGMLIYETFMVGNERYGKPSNPAYLLRTGELLDVVRNRLAVLAFEQGEVSRAAGTSGDEGADTDAEQPTLAVVQRLCAVRSSTLRLPV